MASLGAGGLLYSNNLKQNDFPDYQKVLSGKTKITIGSKGNPIISIDAIETPKGTHLYVENNQHEKTIYRTSKESFEEISKRCN